MKNKLPVILSGVLLLIAAFSAPISAAEAGYSESATAQSYYSLVAYGRMCRGGSPLYVLDNGDAAGGVYEKKGTVGKAKTLADGIVAYKKGEFSSVQEWIDTALTANVAKGAEWYVLALSQSGEYDFEAYEKALLRYLEETPPVAVQTAQKYALALIAAGSRDNIITDIVNRSITDSPIMAQVFGLHLLNNGLKSTAYTAEQVTQKLLAMQRKDGGWAIMGQYGDVDVTAMVLQALAPHRGEPAVKAAADRAIAFLSARQNADGDFSSMGTANCESTAQVITALSDWRIDCQTDPRFIKNGKNVIEGLLQFRRTDGSFSHTKVSKSAQEKNTEETDSASFEKAPETVSSDGEKSVAEPSGITKEQEKDSSTKSIAEEAFEPQDNSKPQKTIEQNATEKTAFEEKSKMGYKPTACLIFLFLAGGAAGVLIVTKKTNRKNWLLLAFVTAAALVLVLVTDFESVTAHKKSAPKTDRIGTVTLSIRCDTVVGKSDSSFIPKDGCMLATCELPIEQGDTVYDVLSDAVKQNDIQMEKKGGDGMVYVSAIGYLYEFQFGEMSGWVYHVNGESPFVGCDSYVLSDGDQVEWFYTLDLGVDVGNTFQSEGEND